MTAELNFTAFCNLQTLTDTPEKQKNFVPTEKILQLLKFGERIFEDCEKNSKVFIGRCAISRNDEPAFSTPTRKLVKNELIIYELKDKTIRDELLSLGNESIISRYFFAYTPNNDFIVITKSGLALMCDNIKYAEQEVERDRRIDLIEVLFDFNDEA